MIALQSAYPPYPTKDMSGSLYVCAVGIQGFTASKIVEEAEKCLTAAKWGKAPLPQSRRPSAKAPDLGPSKRRKAQVSDQR